jgi:hypothetical protein
VNLFGHHHAADQSLSAKVVAFVHGVPVGIWIGVLGIIAAIAAPLVQQFFDRSRARAAGLRTTALVRTDVTARVRAHVAVLNAAAVRGEIDVERWSTTFETLATRVRQPDVIEALGASYRELAGALHAETLALEAARAEASGRGPRVANATDLAQVAATYEPLLHAVDTAARFRRP